MAQIRLRSEKSRRSLQIVVTGNLNNHKISANSTEILNLESPDEWKPGPDFPGGTTYSAAVQNKDSFLVTYFKDLKKPRPF